MTNRSLIALWVVLLLGCSAPQAQTPPLHVFPELGGVGLCQSPINISSTRTSEGHHEVSLDYLPSEQRIVNKGHTVELEWDEGSTVTFDGKVYDFRQLHFHTPSEHLIDSVTYPLELHGVHTLQGDDQVYLVLGLLFKEGEENAFLAKFLDAVPEEPEREVIRREPIDVRELATGSLDYYTYAGSLTTPPYTESVTWVISREFRQASRAQIQRLNALEGNNARHIQPLHGRQVESD